MSTKDKNSLVLTVRSQLHLTVSIMATNYEKCHGSYNVNFVILVSWSTTEKKMLDKLKYRIDFDYQFKCPYIGYQNISKILYRYNTSW